MQKRKVNVIEVMRCDSNRLVFKGLLNSPEVSYVMLRHVDVYAYAHSVGACMYACGQAGRSVCLSVCFGIW